MSSFFNKHRPMMGSCDEWEHNKARICNTAEISMKYIRNAANILHNNLSNTEQITSRLFESLKVIMEMRNIIISIDAFDPRGSNSNVQNSELERQCKDLTDVINYKQESYFQLKTHFQEIHQEKIDLEHKVNDLKDRISQMMCHQEVDRKDAHEDLMDSNRPSSIIERCRSLYREQYGEISAELQDHLDDDKEIARVLLIVFKSSFEITKRHVEVAREKVLESIKDVLNQRPFARNPTRQLSKYINNEVCMMLRETPHPDLFNDFERVMKTKCVKLEKYGPEVTKHLHVYIDECVRVTWLMNACNPPMFISDDDVSFNSEKHSRFSGKGTQVDYFIWPCIYFSEDVYQKNGNVMAKADVALKASIIKPSDRTEKDQNYHKTIDRQFSEEKLRNDATKRTEEAKSSQENVRNSEKQKEEKEEQRRKAMDVEKQRIKEMKDLKEVKAKEEGIHSKHGSLPPITSEPKASTITEAPTKEDIKKIYPKVYTDERNLQEQAWSIETTVEGASTEGKRVDSVLVEKCMKTAEEFEEYFENEYFENFENENKEQPWETVGGKKNTKKKVTSEQKEIRLAGSKDLGKTHKAVQGYPGKVVQQQKGVYQTRATTVVTVEPHSRSEKKYY